MNSKLFKFQFLSIGLAILVGCSDDTNSTEKAVTGTIDFAEAVDLVRLVKAQIKLTDISIADAPEVVISEQIIEPVDEVPISFSVKFKEEEIDPSRLYSVSAAVYEVNDLGAEVRAFMTTQTYPVLTQGFGDEVNVLVERVDSTDTMVTGTVNFAEPVNINNLVKAHIQLADYSIADAPVVVISEQLIEPVDALPIPFSVIYREEQIVPSSAYSVSAAVYEIDSLGVEVRAFMTTQTYPVLTRGFGDAVDVVVERIN